LCGMGKSHGAVPRKAMQDTTHQEFYLEVWRWIIFWKICVICKYHLRWDLCHP
jgi:hypothetical protein